jgi:beta-aspartyl-peptidase (threonine type)
LSEIRKILEHCVARLENGDKALDVAQSAVELLEDCPAFNAGRGSVLDERGVIDMDAAIMDGSTLNCGSVSGVEHVRNPVRLARAIMDKTRHQMLIGQGAENFARQQGLEFVSQEWLMTDRRIQQYRAAHENPTAVQAEGASVKNSVSEPNDDSKGTIGVVVCDKRGHLAAASSTGGLFNKMHGRVGASPLIGCGTYANEYAAVSITGHGEQFMRHSAAYQICARMEFGKESLQEAANHTMARLPPATGGLIAVDSKGNIATPYNSLGMIRGIADAKGIFQYAVWEETFGK